MVSSKIKRGKISIVNLIEVIVGILIIVLTFSIIPLINTYTITRLRDGDTITIPSDPITQNQYILSICGNYNYLGEFDQGTIDLKHLDSGPTYSVIYTLGTYTIVGEDCIEAILKMIPGTYNITINQTVQMTNLTYTLKNVGVISPSGKLLIYLLIVIFSSIIILHGLVLFIRKYKE